MARVAMGGSFRNSVQVRKGAAWYAHYLHRGILTDGRTATLLP